MHHSLVLLKESESCFSNVVGGDLRVYFLTHRPKITKASKMYFRDSHMLDKHFSLNLCCSLKQLLMGSAGCYSAIFLALLISEGKM